MMMDVDRKTLADAQLHDKACTRYDESLFSKSTFLGPCTLSLNDLVGTTALTVASYLINWSYNPFLKPFV